MTLPPDHQPGATAPPDPETLPTIPTSATAKDILERLTVASRRGRLAGFDPRPNDGSLFAAAAHGHPFDSRLVARLEGSVLTFRVELLRRLPLLFAAILAFTIWPGVYFTDELIAQFIPGLWRPWVTYYWYLPLTIIPIPWMWRGVINRSRRSAAAYARETIAAIAKELGADAAQPTPR